MNRPGIVITAILAGAAAALSGCGSSDTSANRIRGDVLTIYSSGPQRGASRLNGQAVLNGEQLALAQVHTRLGKYRLVLKSLDDSTLQSDGWDPGMATVNARLAISDRTAVAYIGEFNSGASAVSIPLLNRAGIPQISPASSAVGLTSGAAGAAPGEPDKYYPTGIRTFVRVVPDDTVQASVQVKLQESLGCRRTYVVDDGEVDGQDLADSFQLIARSAGLDVIGVQAFPPRAPSYVPFATGVAQSGADCVLISALTESGAPLLARQIAAAMPNAQIFATDGVAESTFTNPGKGGIPPWLGARILLTTAALGPPAAPPAAKAFYAAYLRHYGTPEPYAIYGYEAMSLLLDAISRASDRGRHSVLRTKVRDALFETRHRQSVIGAYSITPWGNTTIRRYGVYRVSDGRLRFWKALYG